MCALTNRIGKRLLAAALALLFVCPPEAAARVSCATAALFSLPMPCCAIRAGQVGQAGQAAHAGASRPACCCAQSAASAESATGVRFGARAPSADDCACSKTAPRDSSARPLDESGASDPSGWIDQHARISARVVLRDACSPSVCAASAWRGPPGLACSTSSESSRAPAAGCMRHELLVRGILGLLTGFGTALL